MKSFIVLSVIVLFMIIGWLFNNQLKKRVKPHTSFTRLVFYFATVLLFIFLLSFLMVLAITKLYPGELMK